MNNNAQNSTSESIDIFRFFNEIGIIEQLARNHMERVLPHGLKISQFSVLNHFVRVRPEASPLQLAQAFQVTKGAMTNTIQRLESLGFINVRADPNDGRAKRVRLTEPGRDAHARAIAMLGPELVKLGDVFGAVAFRDALPFLEQVRGYLDDRRN